MKRCFLLPVAVFFVFTGCASHYYKVKESTIHIYLRKPDAKIVHFASSFDGYELHKAIRIDDKTWEITVPTYVEFKYFYIVDGIFYLPPCRFKEDDDFGSENCIYIPDS